MNVLVVVDVAVFVGIAVDVAVAVAVGIAACVKVASSTLRDACKLTPRVAVGVLTVLLTPAAPVAKRPAKSANTPPITTITPMASSVGTRRLFGKRSRGFAEGNT